jgi:hypothetical protein
MWPKLQNEPTEREYREFAERSNNLGGLHGRRYVYPYLKNPIPLMEWSGYFDVCEGLDTVTYGGGATSGMRRGSPCRPRASASSKGNEDAIMVLATPRSAEPNAPSVVSAICRSWHYAYEKTVLSLPMPSRVLIATKILCGCAKRFGDPPNLNLPFGN